MALPLVPLGQVFTPAAVADLAIATGLEGLAPSARLLDPACGDGVFLARAVAAGFAHVEGIDIDPVAVAAARAGGSRVRRADFLTLPPPVVPSEAYDAIVGNPPYVRQEQVGAAKARIAARVAADWPDLPPRWWGGREDLALAFVARALRFVRPGGRVVLVVSTALLEAGHRDALAVLLRGRARLHTVVVSPDERWFPNAAVNAAIIAIHRDPEPGSVRVARLRVPVARACAAPLARVADLREADPDAPLGPILRAPAAWLAAAAGGELVPLSELAVVRRGATSGANGFFYLRREEARARGIEPRFLRPLLRTPRDVERILVDVDRLPHVAFVCDLDEAELAAHPGAAAHVAAAGEVASRPTLAVRPRWWSLPVRPARLFLAKAYSGRFVQPLTDRPVIPDQRVYAVEPRRGVDLTTLAAVLNGTLCALALESLGRASLGEGALEVSVGDAAALPVLDARRLDPARVARRFGVLAARPIGDVFAEAAATDRRALDEVLADAAPAVRDLDVSGALTATVRARLSRARTFD